MNAIKGPIWIKDHVTSHEEPSLLEGIPEDLDKYARAVERALPELPVEDGAIHLQELWIETGLPYDLLETLLKRYPLRWPSNVQRIRLRSEVLMRPPSQRAKGASTPSVSGSPSTPQEETSG